MSITSAFDVQAWLEAAEVFFGELTASEARLYVELQRCEAAEDVELHGKVVGPQSEYSRTLQTTVALLEAPARNTRLCSAFMPDPCFWTPRLPFVYSLELTARRGNQTVASNVRSIGFRPLGTRKRDLFLDSKRVVLRAVDRRLALESPLSEWRETSTSLYTADLDNALLRECTRHGVLACLELTDQKTSFNQQLQEAARHASAGIVVLPAEAFTKDTIGARPRNLLLAALVESGEELAPGADLLVVHADSMENFPAYFDRLSKPVVAVLDSTDVADIHVHRRRCDSLQAKLASRGRLAGYVIRGT